MFLKKKAHNLFKKSIKIELKNVKPSFTQNKNEVVNEGQCVEDSIIEESKPKRTYKPKKVGEEQVVEGEQ